MPRRGYTEDEFTKAKKRYHNLQRDLAATYVESGWSPEDALRAAALDILDVGSLETVTQDRDDGGVEDESEGLDIGDTCSECGQDWTGTL